MGASSSTEESQKNEYEAQLKSRVEGIIADEKRKQNETRAAQEARDERIKTLMRDVLVEEKKKKVDSSVTEKADHVALMMDLFKSLSVSRGAGPDKSQMINLLQDMQQQLGSASGPSPYDGTSAYLFEFIQKQLAELQSMQEVKITVEKKPSSTAHAHSTMEKSRTEISSTLMASVLSNFDPLTASSQKPPLYQNNGQPVQEKLEPSPLKVIDNKPMGATAKSNHFQQDLSPPPKTSFPDPPRFQPPSTLPPSCQDWKNIPVPSAPAYEDNELFRDLKKSNIPPGQHNFKEIPSLCDANKQFKNTTQENKLFQEKGGDGDENNKPVKNIYPDLGQVNKERFSSNKNAKFGDKHLQNKLPLMSNEPNQGSKYQRRVNQPKKNMEHHNNMEYDNGPFLDKGALHPRPNFKNMEGTCPSSNENSSRGSNSENSQRGGFQHRGRGGPQGRGNKSYIPHQHQENQGERQYRDLTWTSGDGQHFRGQKKEGAFALANDDPFRGPSSENYQNTNFHEELNQRGGFQHRGRGGPRGRGNKSYVPHQHQENQGQREYRNSNWTSGDRQHFRGQHDGPRFEDNNDRGGRPRHRGGNNQDQQRSRSRPRFQPHHQSQEALINLDTNDRDGRHGPIYQKGPHRGRGVGPRLGGYNWKNRQTPQEGAWNADTQNYAEDSDHESVRSVESNFNTKTNPTSESSGNPGSAGALPKKKHNKPKKKENKTEVTKGIRSGVKEAGDLEGSSTPLQLFLGVLDDEALKTHDPSTSLPHSVVVIVKLEEEVKSFHPSTIGEFLTLRKMYPNSEVVVVS